jgi:hypothetical protein
MKKRILIIFISIIYAMQVNAQADCFFKYCYTGKVTLSTKIVTSDNIFIQLPSPELMLNIVDKTKGFIKAPIGNQLNFEKESVTIGSSVFCGTPDNIVEKILKGSKKYYTIYIIKGGKKYKKNINIKEILFSYRDGIFYITLPQIII